MLRKFMLAAIAAASLGAAALSGSTAASANPYGYGGPHGGYYGGPPPWARAWGWQRHHHWGYRGRSWGGPPPYARPVPQPHAYGRSYGQY